MIEVRNLVKRYGNHCAVDHLSFTVDDGQIYGFLGPNGAGKSTTMNIITGYLAPTEGEVVIEGHSVMEEPEEARKCIGYLPEMPPVYPEMTVREYLAFCARLKKIPKGEQSAQITRVVALTHLEDVIDRLIRNLSKGYRQRVGLAQAILGFPKIIILDEPTVGLDPKQIIEIRDLIRHLAKEHTVILSSHILSEVRAVCDHILIIHKGKIVACDTPEHLEEQLSGTHTVDLEVKGTAEQAEGIIGTIAGITDCAVEHKTDETVSVHLTSSEDVREKLFRAFAAADCPLLELTPHIASLEEVFLELTESDQEGTERTDPEQEDQEEEAGGEEA